MRQIRFALAPVVLLLVAGCIPQFTKNTSTTQTPSPVPTPDAATLVGYLNDNAKRVQSIECPSLSIDARQGIQTVGLSGMMSCQKPRNFRLQATLFGSPAVDMGSNDTEFWYWISKADPPYLVHCSYQDMATGNVYLPFPFQPDWVMEALGMAEYNPQGKYQVQASRTEVNLIEETVSSQGKPVRKVTVFDLRKATNGVPQVKAHLLQDSGGREICSARVTEVQYDKVSQGVFPYRVTLYWPEERMQMTMRLDSVRVNQLTDQNRIARLFTRPQMPDVRSIDLARIQARPTGMVQRVSGPPR